MVYKQVLNFHRPSKILCQTSGRQNHRSLIQNSDFLATVLNKNKTKFIETAHGLVWHVEVTYRACAAPR
jgi:hypothetical protein